MREALANACFHRRRDPNANPPAEVFRRAFAGLRARELQ